MSQSHPTRPPGRPVEHDPMTCGLGQKYCPGCASDPPDPSIPPWGESLTREYIRILEDWADLDDQNRPGTPKDQRERLAADKVDTFARAAGVRARGVNDLLALLRWLNEDMPGHLADALTGAVKQIVTPELDALARAIVRIEDRLDHFRGAR